MEIRVRRIHRRDLNRTWEFLKLVFRDVNRETVEYQRPYSKRRFTEVYEQGSAEQLLFESEAGEIVGYAECSFDTSGDDNWINPRYFDKRGMRPLYVDELAVHPEYQGHGVGSFMVDQLQHLARVRGCTHLVLEVAENNESALAWYRKRNFFKLDAAIFMAQKVLAEPELLPPRKLPQRRRPGAQPQLSLAAGEKQPDARRTSIGAAPKRRRSRVETAERPADRPNAKRPAARRRASAKEQARTSEPLAAKPRLLGNAPEVPAPEATALYCLPADPKVTH
jgi:ribosomal protein S18 acetylase RimI-like enzyme